jgi:PAS domain S-box-containing protein
MNPADHQNQPPRAEPDLAGIQARLAAIIASAMDAIISVDASQRIVLFNAAAEKMFRCKAGEVLGQSLDRLLLARAREVHHRAVPEFGRTGETVRRMGHLQPLSGLRANGEEFPVEVTISHVEVGGEKLYTAIVRDITERQRAQEQLNLQAAALKDQAQLLRQAQESVRQLNLELEQRVESRTAELAAAIGELESFTHSVAHDLRAPLRHIDAFARLLEEEHAAALPADARRYLEVIRNGSRQMNRLIDDLLNLSRVGRQVLKQELTPLGPLVQEVIAGLASEFQGRHIEWRVQPLPSVRCDPGLMKQVFSNLLGNAAKYTRLQPRAIIEVGALDSNGGATIFVRDNGVGFDMKYADKLFGVFQRLHQAEEFEGTGVGLATVERIVRKHGGRVWAEATAGKGAAFYFAVPTSAPAFQSPAPADPA